MPKQKKSVAQTNNTNTQVLPSKEAALFKQILKFYEIKQYKKGLKAADTILKKFPNHGETLAMKGLTIYYLKRKDAESYIKKGLEMNIKSHVCWHVYGLLYRAEHKYPDAIKCYQQALRIDPNNLQILKDLSLLQIQRRMLPEFQETRRKILLLKTNNKNNWIAYAIGNHLSKNYEKCIAVIDSYQKTLDQENKSTESLYEDSELKLYKNMVIQESGHFEKALAHLNDIAGDVLDKLSLKLTKAALLNQLGKRTEAEAEYRSLLEMNPENAESHEGLRVALELTSDPTGKYSDETLNRLLALYDSLSKQYPKAVYPIRYPLTFLPSTHPTLKTCIDAYLKRGLRKGLPSLFRDLRPLYTDPGKVAIIEELINGYLVHLRKDNRFSQDDPVGQEYPSVLLWTLYFAGGHYDHLSETKKGLEIVEEAIAHTPTTIDLYVLKARLYKHAENYKAAFEQMDKARELDLADRYLNTKCVRYAFRANKIEQALSIVKLFLRGEDGDALQNLYEMQCSWFELACGDSYLRQNEYGKALKKYLAVEKHFEDMHEDQFDFHTYCLRKMTLRAYIKMLRFEDNLKSHKFYFRAAKAAIDTYLRIYDSRQKAVQATEATLNNEKLSEAEKKAILKKQKRDAKKADKKAEKEAKAKAEEAEAKKKAEGGDKKKPSKEKEKEEDTDPDGVKLAKTEKPLEEATRFVNDLRIYLRDKLDTHVYAIEVYSRKQKYLLWLQALKHARKINRNDPQVHYSLIKFFHTVASVESKLSPVIKQVIDIERKNEEMGGGLSLEKINDMYLEQFKHLIPHRLSVAKSLALFDLNANKSRIISLTSTLDSSATIKDCKAVYEFLISIDESKVAEVYKQECHKRFPFTPFFAPIPTKEELEKEQKEKGQKDETNGKDDQDGKEKDGQNGKDDQDGKDDDKEDNE